MTLALVIGAIGTCGPQIVTSVCRGCRHIDRFDPTRRHARISANLELVVHEILQALLAHDHQHHIDRLCADSDIGKETAAANEADIVMVHTGVRLFLH